MMKRVKVIAEGAFNVLMWTLVMTLLIVRDGWSSAWRQFDVASRGA